MEKRELKDMELNEAMLDKVNGGGNPLTDLADEMFGISDQASDNTKEAISNLFNDKNNFLSGH